MKTNFIYVLLISLLFITVSCRDKGSQQALQPTGEAFSELHPWAKDAIIYEVNLRQYTPEGTFQAFKAHMPRLAEMGVDILWFMPIHPIGELNRKGQLGSYYAVKDYKAVNPEFGTLADFLDIVNTAQTLGMKVMLDWVANHSAWDNAWVAQHADFYEMDANGNFVSPYDWTDVIAFNYENRQMRDSMLSALVYWVETARIDGYRCDVAGLVPVDFWEEARLELEKIKPVFMLAEDEDNVDLLSNAFEMNYAWNFHHQKNQIGKGEKQASALWDYLDWNNTRFPRSSYRMHFITNHDENSWNGTIQERLGEGHEAFAVLCWTLPGMPLIYSGEEAGDTKRLRFFDKDTIDWGSFHKLDFYHKLRDLRKNNAALWSNIYGGEVKPMGETGNDHILAYYREKDENLVMVIINLSPVRQTTSMQTQPASGMFRDAFTGASMELSQPLLLDLAAWEYVVLIRQAS